jgi:hypothetical protein
MRGRGAAVATLILSLAIAAGAFALPSDPELGRLAADGPVSISSSRAGGAILHGENLMPGEPVTGLITLTNKGDKPGKLALSLSGLRDRPGIYGGRLSSVLRLRIDDLTSGGRPIETTLKRSTPIALADLRGRQARTYKLTAWFPDTGVPAGPAVGDNLQQGSRVEVAMQWQLTERPSAPPPPVPAQPPVVMPAPAPLPMQAPERPRLVTLRVPAQRVIAPRKLVAFAMCEVKCKLRFNAKLDNAPAPSLKGNKAKKRRTIMGRKVIKKQRRWFKVKRVSVEKRFTLKLTKKALRKLKSQLRRKGRAGITVTATMRSAIGNRTVRRRIVMRTYKKGFRGRPSRMAP